MTTYLAIRYPSSPPRYLARGHRLVVEVEASLRFRSTSGPTMGEVDPVRAALLVVRTAAERFARRATMEVLRELGGGDLNRGAEVLCRAEVVAIGVREVVEAGESVGPAMLPAAESAGAES